MRNADTIVLNASPAPSPEGGFSAHDIFYALYRHKWKLIFFTLLGIAAGAAVFLTAKPSYVSQASVIVKYVVQGRLIGSDGTMDIRSPDNHGEKIINSELEMILSDTLVRQVVAQVGASNIVTDPEVTDLERAARRVVRRGLEAWVPLNSSVIKISFRHPNPAVVQAVLTNHVANYLRMHREVHRSTDGISEVARQVDLRRIELEKTERQLRTLRDELGVLGIASLDETKRAYLDQIGQLQANIRVAEAQLAESYVALGALTNSLGSIDAASAQAAMLQTNALSQEIIDQYRRVRSRIDLWSQKEQALSTEFTPQSPMLSHVISALNAAMEQRRELEEKHPALLYLDLPSNASGRPGATQAVAAKDPAAAIREHRALEARYMVMTNQLASLGEEISRLTQREAEIARLELKARMEREQYQEQSAVLERAAMEEQLSRGKITNIQVIDQESLIYADYGNRLKLAGGLAFGGFGFALCLVLLLELYVDSTIRRPSQFERQLKIPLFLSIPRLHLNGSSRRALPGPGETSNGAGGPVAAPSGPDELTTYAEALRDRLMMHFQLHGLNHKPKLVGVTSCGRGSGVTTLATRLAASLSETGDGNVLYVDVNQDRGPSVHPFKDGQLRVGIRDALEAETRDAAKVQDNLYMVSLADPASGRVGVIPKTLSGLVPRMKASDYDYIIFDLPPITQTSATAKVAGLLDMTFIVVESENTQTDLVRKATTLLAESRANVAAVLNKHRRYLPERLDTDL